MRVIETNTELTFSDIYKTYYPKLVRFVREYVGELEDAENLVQDIFMHLWSNPSLLDSVLNLNAFLFTLGKNRSIDFLRARLVEQNRHNSMVIAMEYQLSLSALEEFDSRILDNDNLDHLIQEAINSLPERCREIFIMSKIKGLKYSEIAEELNISTSTVDNQMGIALKKLRIKLKDYLPLFIYLTSI